MRRIVLIGCLLAWGPVVWQATLVAQNRPVRATQRAQPPDWDRRSTAGVFFENAFTEGLVGQRPPSLGSVAATVPVPPAGGPPPATPSAQPAPGSSTGGYAWSQVISPAVIEDEIKSLKLAVDQVVTTPTKFAGSDYKNARRYFSLLAMLFAIVAEYDGEVRWKQDAPAARDLFARTAGNAKVGTIQVFNEAKQRKDDLSELIGGGRLQGQGAAETDWSLVCDRSPLMQWLERALDERLAPASAEAPQFQRGRDQLLHDAELVAAIAAVLGSAGMDDADDEEYAAFCARMKGGALQVVEAVKLNDQAKARAAVGEINKACSECHEAYRD